MFMTTMYQIMRDLAIYIYIYIDCKRPLNMQTERLRNQWSGYEIATIRSSKHHSLCMHMQSLMVCVWSHQQFSSLLASSMSVALLPVELVCQRWHYHEKYPTLVTSYLLHCIILRENNCMKLIFQLWCVSYRENHYKETCMTMKDNQTCPNYVET